MEIRSGYELHKMIGDLALDKFTFIMAGIVGFWIYCSCFYSHWRGRESSEHNCSGIDGFKIFKDS